MLEVWGFCTGWLKCCSSHSLKTDVNFFLNQNHAQFLNTSWFYSISKTKLDTEALEKQRLIFHFCGNGTRLVLDGTKWYWIEGCLTERKEIFMFDILQTKTSWGTEGKQVSKRNCKMSWTHSVRVSELSQGGWAHQTVLVGETLLSQRFHTGTCILMASSTASEHEERLIKVYYRLRKLLFLNC